jgi:uncharacterized linocin/CFP29 family protein
MTQAEKKAFEEIKNLTVHNNELIKELLITIRGNAEMGVKGLLKQQAEDEDFRQQIMTKISDLESHINKEFSKINEWRQKIDIYIGLLVSSKVWRVLIVISAIIGFIWLAAKGGWLKAIHWLNL